MKEDSSAAGLSDLAILPVLCISPSGAVNRFDNETTDTRWTDYDRVVIEWAWPVYRVSA